MSRRPFPRRAVLALAALVLIVAVLVVGRMWRSESEPDPSATPGETAGRSPDASTDASMPASTRAPPAPTASAHAPADTRTWPPLPATTEPLAAVLDELLDRAQRGDSKAACRLGAELQRCLIAHAAGAMAADVERDASRRREVPDAAVDAIARMQTDAERRGEGCAGVGLDQLKTAFQWQRQAALADPGLRVAFALSPALDPRDFVNELDHWQAYRAVALPWLEAAAAEGDVAAVIALARVYGDMRRTSPRIPPFRVHDDERFVIYADLMQRYGSHYDIVAKEADAARQRLSPEHRQRARERVDALFKAEAVLDATQSRQAMRTSLQGTTDPERCE